jgi:23S rRNA (adenine2503-C2)-methyltransferase
MGCKFCASGQHKKIRNLTVDEIVLQFITVQNNIKEKINNVIFMGIGEPFDNYKNLITSINILTCDFGIAIGMRHITVSTCGIANKIIKFANDAPKISLAISLHATNDAVRSEIMPITKSDNITSLIEAIKKYQSITKRLVTFEYLVLANVNDTNEQANELVELIKNNKIDCTVNLISYNEVKGSQFKPSINTSSFAKVLIKHNINVTTRIKMGNKINGGCGQLRINYGV